MGSLSFASCIFPKKVTLRHVTYYIALPNGTLLPTPILHVGERSIKLASPQQDTGNLRAKCFVQHRDLTQYNSIRRHLARSFCKRRWL